MAFVASIRATGAGSTPARSVLYAMQTVIGTTAFSEGATITLTTIGTGIIADSMVMNYQDNIMARRPTIAPAGIQYDYFLSGPDEITLNFGDDPANYAGGQLQFQIQYAYYA